MSTSTPSALSPRFRPHALAAMADPVSIDLGWCELRVTEAAGAQLASFLHASDGARELGDFAGLLGWTPARVNTLAATLYTRGVIEDSAGTDVDAMAFQEHVVSWGRTLRAEMSRNADLLGSSPHRRLLLGSLVETWHFVSSASYHIGAAVAHAPSSGTREALSALFVEEWKHGRDLAQGLRAAGLSEQTLARARPLPGTQAVIHYLYALACTDLLSYGACAAINESPRTDLAIKERWDQLADLELLPRAALAPFRGHEFEDEASGHAAISASMFCEHHTLSGLQQRRIRGHVSSFILTQQACYDALRQFYGAVEGPACFEG